MSTLLRPANLRDMDAIIALLPELASFDVPQARDPAHLWEGDMATLQRWQAGREPNCLVHIAEIDDVVVGFTLVRLCDELLSHEPSAHLEAIVVAESARGTGLGRTLLDNAEQVARAAGAGSMTLHVFANNKRARSVYRGAGYAEELLRNYKQL
jgi:ribosomal protein S18 acetylase RimI-like enzyme